MSKYKASWALYSARRKITLSSLISQGKIKDYKTYTDYCESFQVEPMHESEFLVQTKDMIPYKDQKMSSAESMPDVPKAQDETNSVSATVWLAGISGAQANEEVPVLPKKKKAKDSAPESST